MKKITEKNRKILRWIFKTISLTSVAFVFQACYGTPDDYYYYEDVEIRGLVKSKTTNQPIEGIQVSVDTAYSFHQVVTNVYGGFSIFVPQNSTYTLRFTDIDFAENGEFLTKDTVVNRNDVANPLDIKLDAK